MKRLGFVLVIGASLALSSPAAAGQIQVGYAGSSYGKYQTGQGGEFTLNDVNPDGWLDLSGYVAGKTSNIGDISSFQSFCIEKNEFLYPYTATYDATLSSAAVKGGVGGGNPDALSQGTAYLYSQFAQGTLDGYTYVGDAARKASAAALQEAIWWLEEEIASYTAGNAFIGAVATEFGTAATARNNATAGQFGVWVLNLTGAGGGAPSGVGQDQLYYKVPDGGTTFMLFGMALTGVGLVSRRIRRS